MGVTTTEPTLGFFFSFAELYQSEGLSKLDRLFLDQVRDADPGLAARLAEARANPPEKSRDQADLLIALAPHLDDFMAALFNLRGEMQTLASRQDALAPLWACKRLFVQRRAMKALRADEAEAVDGEALARDLSTLLGPSWDELTFARQVMRWLDDEPANGAALTLAARYAAWALMSSAGRKRHQDGHLFKAPAKHDPLQLVGQRVVAENGLSFFDYPPERLRRREGFALTDPGCDLAGALDEIHYCILCHHQGKDSCSKGARDKASGGFAKNALGTVQAGCPLEERIS
ncbi:MAG TPA: pyridine nucleotide-disulfide oxidoreductase, partial [Rhodospirillaceae bacterium]|nr:pyridine nucleotide-disulfide oxidoreductase [Rhodospirillaceae bacterium]